MLDGMIAFAETLVAMQELSKVAGDDQIIEIGDIIIKDKFTSSWTNFKEWIQQRAKETPELQKGLEKIKIGDKTLA